MGTRVCNTLKAFLDLVDIGTLLLLYFLDVFCVSFFLRFMNAGDFFWGNIWVDIVIIMISFSRMLLRVFFLTGFFCDAWW